MSGLLLDTLDTSSSWSVHYDMNTRLFVHKSVTHLHFLLYNLETAVLNYTQCFIDDIRKGLIASVYRSCPSSPWRWERDCFLGGRSQFADFRIKVCKLVLFVIILFCCSHSCSHRLGVYRFIVHFPFLALSWVSSPLAWTYVVVHLWVDRLWMITMDCRGRKRWVERIRCFCHAGGGSGFKRKHTCWVDVHTCDFQMWIWNDFIERLSVQALFWVRKSIRFDFDTVFQSSRYGGHIGYLGQRGTGTPTGQCCCPIWVLKDCVDGKTVGNIRGRCLVFDGILNEAKQDTGLPSLKCKGSWSRVAPPTSFDG